MKLLGLDYGRRRIGIAVTDETGDTIRGLPTLDRRKIDNIFLYIHHMLETEKPSKIIIGLPLDTDDRPTEMSEEICDFAKKLQKHTAVPIEFVDESLSSRRAAHLLRFRKRKVRHDKKSVDRLAACCILETYQREKLCEH
jgi:putative Holliday junction resolvase